MPGVEVNSMSRTTTTITKPKKVLLSSRATVDKHEASLVGVQGAEELITLLAGRRSVTRLLLSHNRLSDDGCARLFEYLCNAEVAKHPIAEISLNSNCIRDEGVRAIARYLEGNGTLKKLFIHNNAFAFDKETAEVFAEALNSSQLRALYLSNNPSISDDSLANLLPLLSSTSLRELQLSVTHITAASGPLITQYIRSPSFRLETLKLNGNNLGLSVVRDIVRTIKEHNHTLTHVEMSANTVEEDEKPKEPWKEIEAALKVVLKRNQLLRDRVGRDAQRLLRYSRAVLLPTTDASSSPSEQQNPNQSDDQRRQLPVEIQLQILSYLSPTLSPTQRIRVFEYASDRSTLPSLALPSLKGTKSWAAQCVPDPTAIGAFPPVQPDHGGCAGGKCMGVGNSVSCRREGERLRWLEVVGCEFYDSCGNDLDLGLAV